MDRKIPTKRSGLTLIELTVAITIALLILLIVSSTFILNQRVFRKSNLKSELVQNARITLDLMSREIRQAKELVTILPTDDSDPLTVPHEIQFEDGHTTSQIQYIRYFLDSDDLKKQIIVYYFDTDPSTYVYWDDVDAFGAPDQSVLEEKIIGENFSSMNFFGGDNITIELFLEKQTEAIEIDTVINPRNI
ncbi:MAG: prepilin-type N-terminal cleavage/methylation domain-containing protein [Candidatus Buchananbacteria bacterium]|nr:prepilin-type N-terminal cleavage/methylation domain-containing protein [Candidatus Buchananbacteria bacterium]